MFAISRRGGLWVCTRPNHKTIFAGYVHVVGVVFQSDSEANIGYGFHVYTEHPTFDPKVVSGLIQLRIEGDRMLDQNGQEHEMVQELYLCEDGGMYAVPMPYPIVPNPALCFSLEEYRRPSNLELAA